MVRGRSGVPRHDMLAVLRVSGLVSRIDERVSDGIAWLNSIIGRAVGLRVADGVAHSQGRKPCEVG